MRKNILLSVLFLSLLQSQIAPTFARAESQVESAKQGQIFSLGEDDGVEDADDLDDAKPEALADKPWYRRYAMGIASGVGFLVLGGVAIFYKRDAIRDFKTKWNEKRQCQKGLNVAIKQGNAIQRAIAQRTDNIAEVNTLTENLNQKSFEQAMNAVNSELSKLGTQLKIAQDPEKLPKDRKKAASDAAATAKHIQKEYIAPSQLLITQLIKDKEKCKEKLEKVKAKLEAKNKEVAAAKQAANEAKAATQAATQAETVATQAETVATQAETVATQAETVATQAETVAETAAVGT